MSNTTWIPDGLQQLQSPKAFDQNIRLLTNKVTLDALPYLRFMRWAESNIKKVMNYKRPSILLDRDDAALGRTLKQWGAYTEIQAQNREARRRDEMFFDFKYDSVTKAEIEGLTTDDNQFRDTVKLRYETMLRIFPKLQNDLLTSGSGSLYSDSIGQRQTVEGYQTVLGTTLTGTYAKVPVTANASHQWQIVNGDAGPSLAFASDATERMRALIRATTVDVDGKEMQANSLFTNLDTMALLENNLLASGTVMFTPAGDEKLGMGAREYSIYQTPVMRDETITANRVYALASDTWQIISPLGSMIDVVPTRRMNNTVGNDVWMLARTAFQLYCRELRPNGVLYYA